MTENEYLISSDTKENFKRKKQKNKINYSEKKLCNKKYKKPKNVKWD